jgi:hypothetical protein
VGLIVRVPRTNRQFRSLVNTPPRSIILLSAPIMRTLMLSNSSGISASVSLRHECYRLHTIQPPACLAVNSPVGRTDSFGDPNEQGHPVVNGLETQDLRVL